MTEEKAKDLSQYRGWRTLGLLYVSCAIEGADLQLLPSTFRAMEASIGLSPSNLALLSLVQAFTSSAAAPVWGSLVDRGWSRKWLLVSGTAGWGALTLLLAFVTHFPPMIFLRFLNGIALASIMPISQSLIAELADPVERGGFFGWVQFAQSAGAVAGAMFAVTISNMVIWQIEGWRIACIAIAAVSFLLALFMAAAMLEPPQENREADSRTLLSHALLILSYFRIDTFRVIVVQGMFGSIPHNALLFGIMYFQYVGISDFGSAQLFAIAGAGQGIGGVIGGHISDHLTAWSRYHGRPLTAQLSVILGLPLIVAVFAVVPKDAAMFGTYALLLLFWGLLSSWCNVGVNRPILSEIVAPDKRASILAWLCALEGSSAAIFGSPVVGLLAEQVFGYQKQTGQISEMPVAIRNSNAAALSSAILCCTVVPTLVCFTLYSLLHWTYEADLTSDASPSSEPEVLARGQASSSTALL